MQIIKGIAIAAVLIIAGLLAVRSAGTGAANLQGRNARKATLASIGERAKCATE